MRPVRGSRPRRGRAARGARLHQRPRAVPPRATGHRLHLRAARRARRSGADLRRGGHPHAAGGARRQPLGRDRSARAARGAARGHALGDQPDHAGGGQPPAAGSGGPPARPGGGARRGLDGRRAMAGALGRRHRPAWARRGPAPAGRRRTGGRGGVRGRRLLLRGGCGAGCGVRAAGAPAGAVPGARRAAPGGGPRVHRAGRAVAGGARAGGGEPARRGRARRALRGAAGDRVPRGGAPGAQPAGGGRPGPAGGGRGAGSSSRRAGWRIPRWACSWIPTTSTPG